jgi:hypothetical protein
MSGTDRTVCRLNNCPRRSGFSALCISQYLWIYEHSRSTPWPLPNHLLGESDRENVWFIYHVDARDKLCQPNGFVT